jgi:DNA-binding PucR family transcriptional regulator
MGSVANDPLKPSGELSSATVVQVADLLRLSEFAGTTVVAGHDGLDRVVARANVMEVPDIVEWVKPQELLLTTGYPLRDVPGGVARLAALIAALDAKGVAAVGVKLHRYLEELPADMLAAADAAGLPILLLPDDVAFDDLLGAIMGEVLGGQSALLAGTDAVDRLLLPLVLAGGGLDDLIDTYGKTAEGAVWACTTDGRVLAAAAGSIDDGVGLGNPELVAESGRFRSERFSPGVHQTGDIALAVASITAGSDDHGRLVLLRQGESIAPLDWHMLQRAATLAALVITKTLAVRAVEAKYRGDFLRDVVLDRAGDADVVFGHFEALGWDVDRPLLVVIASLDPIAGDRESPSDARVAQERFANAWVYVVGRLDRTAPVVGFAQEVVALVGVPDDETPREVVDRIVQRVSGDGGGGRRSFATGVSRVVDDIAQLAAAYEQARRSVQVGRQMHGVSSVAHFDDLGSFRLLSLIDDSRELRSFVNEVLGELADESDPVAADLRHTLRVLLDTNVNVAESSRRLHFHYNTLRYRISKLEEAVGPFTTDPDLQLNLSLALRVLHMRGL